jgi:hypothetical protein
VSLLGSAPLTFVAIVAFSTYSGNTAMSASDGGRRNFFATAAGAALAAVYPGKSPIKFVRINVAGKCATVLMHGAMMESTPQEVPILVERFPFGWQALEALNFLCRLTAHGLGTSTEERLMRGMPTPQDDRPCPESDKDVGPQQQVEALRRTSDGPLTPTVKVVGDWAVVGWYGAGGGQALYRLGGGQWKLVQGGGGALNTDNVRDLGVRETAWCVFEVGGAKCG